MDKTSSVSFQSLPVHSSYCPLMFFTWGWYDETVPSAWKVEDQGSARRKGHGVGTGAVPALHLCPEG